MSSRIESSWVDPTFWAAYRNEIGGILKRSLEQLSPRQWKVLTLRLGLDGEEPLNQSSVANLLRTTYQNIQQIEGRALRKLGRRLKPYVQDRTEEDNSRGLLEQVAWERRLAFLIDVVNLNLREDIKKNLQSSGIRRVGDFFSASPEELRDAWTGRPEELRTAIRTNLAYLDGRVGIDITR